MLYLQTNLTIYVKYFYKFRCSLTALNKPSIGQALNQASGLCSNYHNRAQHYALYPIGLRYLGILDFGICIISLRFLRFCIVALSYLGHFYEPKGRCLRHSTKERGSFLGSTFQKCSLSDIQEYYTNFFNITALYNF